MSHLRICLLPVGQADCILIQFPDDSWAVVDCGSQQRAAFMALEYLASQPPHDTPVRFILATHPDADHVGGIPDLLSFCPRRIQHVYHSGAERRMERGAGPRFLTLPRRARELYEAGRLLDDLRPLKAGDTIAWDPPIEGLTISVLNPKPGSVGREPVRQGSSNNNSVVLQILYGDVRVLLAGDIEPAAWGLVVQRPEFQPPHVLKVSHHGALSGMPPAAVFAPVQGIRWALLSTATGIEDKPDLKVLESFWPSWTTRCTGWSPHCTEADKEPYPVPPGDPHYPESFQAVLRAGSRSQVYEVADTEVGCCPRNEITIQANGTISHSRASKSCDTR